MPASYPTAAKTFASRSNGAVIDASHVQDLQDEVTAIESGLLNGTAPVLSSNITTPDVACSSLTVGVHALLVGGISVAGASTISGNLQVSGNSTFSGSVAFTGTVTGIALNPPRVRLSHSSSQTLSTTAFTGLSWDTERYDSAGMHSTASNSSRITFAGSTGIYHVGAQITCSTLASGGVMARILVNDSSECLAQFISASNIVTNAVNLSGDVLIASTADYITVQVKLTTSTGSVLAESSNAALGFWAHHIST